MSETRDKQIEEAYKKEYLSLLKDHGISVGYDGFICGAQWADQNPEYHQGAAIETALLRVRNEEKEIAQLKAENSDLKRRISDSLLYAQDLADEIAKFKVILSYMLKILPTRLPSLKGFMSEREYCPHDITLGTCLHCWEQCQNKLSALTAQLDVAEKALGQITELSQNVMPHTSFDIAIQALDKIRGMNDR